jgi:hypothetical protein
MFCELFVTFVRLGWVRQFGFYPKTRSAIKKPHTKDPRGGLTAAGRREFARKEGDHLRPGGKKSTGEMSTQEMKRKGSWAGRFSMDAAIRCLLYRTRTACRPGSP